MLLLDEPAAGLNSTESALLGERIREISQAGTSVLLVDHDVRFVLDVCHPVYVLDVGRIIAEGSPEQIRAEPRGGRRLPGHDPQHRGGEHS